MKAMASKEELISLSLIIATTYSLFFCLIIENIKYFSTTVYFVVMTICCDFVAQMLKKSTKSTISSTSKHAEMAYVLFLSSKFRIHWAT